MAIVILLLNAATMFWLCRWVIKNKQVILPMKNHLVISYESFRKPHKMFEWINQRYRVQTQLFNKIQLTEMGIIYLLWAMASSLIALYIPLYDGLRYVSWLALMTLPILILELRLEWIEQTIDRSLFSFLSNMNASLLKTEDLMQALSEVEKKLDNKYMVLGIRLFNSSIKSGISPELAFNRLNADISHDYLRYVYLNIEQTYQKNGDSIELMRALENEYTSIQIEFNKRKIELRHDRNLTIFSLTLVLLTALRIARSNDYIESFYTTLPSGQRIGVFLALGLFMGITMVLLASRKKL